MEVTRLTLKEIEQKIDKFRERSETLTDIINDVTEDSVKRSLQTQIDYYDSLLVVLRNELAFRNIKHKD